MASTVVLSSPFVATLSTLTMCGVTDVFGSVDAIAQIVISPKRLQFWSCDYVCVATLLVTLIVRHRLESKLRNFEAAT